MPKPIYTLTAEDELILEHSSRLEYGPDGRPTYCGSYLTSFYLRSPEQPAGWEFDHNIDPAWQLKCHHAPQPDIIVIGGFGASKTVGIAGSATCWATVLPDFKFLNVAPTAWQSKQMYDKILEMTADTLFSERFLWKNVEKPFPKITIKYKLRNGKTHLSTLEFMSASDDAHNIRTWEGDWCNIDQAELVDNLTELWSELGSRTRGSTRAGREKMGRLSGIANADDNPELWSLAGMAQDYPDTNRFFLVPTGSNKNLSKSQVDSFKRRLGNDPERIAQYLDAKEPLGKGVEFGSELVRPCIDPSMDEMMEHNLSLEVPGFAMSATRAADIVLWELPPEADRSYLVVGDPGQGHPPLRNAPVVMVFDVTDFPQSPCVLRAFWWGEGKASYKPWIQQFQYYMAEYKAINGAFDATGGQKVHSETTFDMMINVLPIDLSNVKKRSCMVTLKLVMMKQLLRIPGKIKGLTSQLMKYRLPDEKIPQDIVSTLFLLAGYLRAMGYEIPEETPPDAEGPELAPTVGDRYFRPGGSRYTRSNRR